MVVLSAHATPTGTPGSVPEEIKVCFAPALHLAERRPLCRYTLQELGLEDPYGITDFAVTEPFQLLTEAGVEQLLLEVLSKEVQRQCAFKEARLPWYNTLRGASRHAPFLRQLWTSEEVVSIVSEAAGIQLKPVMDYELGHTNILWPGPDEEKQDHWHCDSYPFVAVMLLTDPKAGGSTVLQKGDGAEVALQYPAAGSCIVMQGQPIQHCARRAVSRLTEPRISIVCSFVPADPLLPDNSLLSAGRRNSQLPELFHDWAEYRLARVGHKAIRLAQELEVAKRERNKLADINKVKSDIAELVSYLQQTAEEITEPDVVRKDVFAISQ